MAATFLHVVERGEVDAVLEEPVRQQLDGRPPRDEQVLRDAEIAITDVFRGERQEYPALRAVRLRARQQVEQQEEPLLAARRQRDVLGADLPAALAAQEPGQGRRKVCSPAGSG